MTHSKLKVYPILTTGSFLVVLVISTSHLIVGVTYKTFSCIGLLIAYVKHLAFQLSFSFEIIVDGNSLFSNLLLFIFCSCSAKHAVGVRSFALARIEPLTFGVFNQTSNKKQKYNSISMIALNYSQRS